MQAWEHNPVRTMRNLISNWITKTTAQNNNAVASTSQFEKFAACSDGLDLRAVKGGNGEEEEGAEGIVIEDIIVD